MFARKESSLSLAKEELYEEIEVLDEPLSDHNKDFKDMITPISERDEHVLDSLQSETKLEPQRQGASNRDEKGKSLYVEADSEHNLEIPVKSSIEDEVVEDDHDLDFGGSMEDEIGRPSN